MQDWLAFACLIGAIMTLIALSVIDLRVRLLPDKLVLIFAILGVCFHIVSDWAYFQPEDIILGAAIGFGILYGIRFVANRLYGQDALGLGDVKLLAAAGLWLAVDGVLAAMTLGALFGLLHGLLAAFYTAIKTRRRPNLSRLEVPAGPGFALGIIAIGIYQFGFHQTGFPWPGR